MLFIELSRKVIVLSLNAHLIQHGVDINVFFPGERNQLLAIYVRNSFIDLREQAKQTINGLI